MSTAALELRSLLLNGSDRSSERLELIEAHTDVTMIETITGASSVEIELNDPRRALLRSPTIKQTCKLVLDDAGFELAAVRKSGSKITLVFEDIAIAALRKRNRPRKVGANQMSRAQFSQLLIKEEPWIRVNTTKGPRALEELARGEVDEDSAAVDERERKQKEPENTWEAVNRIMGEIQWRVFARRGQIYIYPDSYLTARFPYTLSESAPGVLAIDFDFDVGKPAAKATVKVLAGFHDVFAGMAIKLEDMGPADGNWIIEEVRRKPQTRLVDLTLLRPQAALAEPRPSDAEGEDGYRSDYVISPGKYGDVNLSAEQLSNAKIIYSTGKSLKASDRDVIIALMTAMQESGLRNLDHGDRDSLGLFQQRPSQGWGTRAQILNPVYASRKFYEALFKLGAAREKMSLSQAAQAVQRSAYPDAYAKWENEARAILKAIQEGLSAGSAGKPVVAGSGNLKVFVDAMLSAKGLPYVWGASGPNSFDCSGLVQWSAAKAGVSFGKPVTAQYAACQRGGTLISVAEAITTYGALLMRVNQGGTNHIAVSLGNGQTMEAMGTAYGCRIGNATGNRGWTHGGRVPGLRGGDGPGGRAN